MPANVPTSNSFFGNLAGLNAVAIPRTTSDSSRICCGIKSHCAFEYSITNVKNSGQLPDSSLAFVKTSQIGYFHCRFSCFKQQFRGQMKRKKSETTLNTSFFDGFG